MLLVLDVTFRNFSDTDTVDQIWLNLTCDSCKETLDLVLGVQKP